MAFERISLNIIPDGEMPVFHASQFDAGRPIIIDLYNGDDAYTPAAGVTFELHCRKVDDNIVTLDTYEVDGNTITFASTEQLCACSGDNLCEVAIMLDELLMGTLNFILHVERDPLAGGLTSETSIYNLTQQIDDIITGEGYVKDTDLDVLQSDWNEDDPTSPAYIKNKPGPALADQADWTETDPLKQSYIKHKPDLKTVATSGSYNDLTDKPTIPTKTSELTNDSGFVESSDLAAVATSGDYDDLLNKPSIPAAQVQSDYAQTNSGAVDFIKNKPILPFESKGQYLIKTTPATKHSIEFTTLIGGTCGVNQLVQNGNFADTSNWTDYNATSSVNSNILTVTANSQNGGIIQSITLINTHKYLISVDIKTTSETTNVGVALLGRKYSTATTNWQNISFIDVSDRDGNVYFYGVRDFRSSGWDSIQVKNVNVIDLTSYFNPAIADYVYTLESGTSGAGITWLKNNGFFGADYYPYNAGGLLSVKTSKKINRDSNNVIIGEYLLDDIELRGILKLDGNNNLYYDGDTYESNGSVTRKYEYRAYASGDESLPDTITDGTYTVTKLVTPTTETADPFTNPMIVDGNGTEEFVDGRTVEMPVGHDTFYIPMN